MSLQERNDELGSDVGCSRDPSRASHSILCSFPNLIEDLGRQCGLFLWQEATIVLLHDVWRVLNGVACLLVGSGLLQNMRRKNVAQVMGSMRQKPLIAPRPV